MPHKSNVDKKCLGFGFFDGRERLVMAFGDGNVDCDSDRLVVIVHGDNEGKDG